MDTGCADSEYSRDAEPHQDSSRARLVAFAPLLPLAALLVLWLSGALDRFDSAQKVAGALGSLRHSPLALLYVLLGFGVGAVLFVPITALIAGTMLAFGPLWGLVYAFLGLQLAAAITYACGRALGGRALDYLSGPRIQRFREQLREHAVRASAAARVLPIGNFTLLNWLIGGLKVPFRCFFLGNALGALPGLAVFAVFADRIGSALRDPQPGQIALLCGVGVGVLLVGWLLRHLVKRAMP